ncbi:hypothetical protein ACE7GA_06255 [Roseomonas sp. CCTCC AB2023176]|uniref:hypothetical protein n=1 Tax=Roseomonas sp. CCTCC AB2023176 TaxID=3342640 RepID=UPI0035D6F81A
MSSVSSRRDAPARAAANPVEAERMPEAPADLLGALAALLMAQADELDEAGAS